MNRDRVEAVARQSLAMALKMHIPSSDPPPDEPAPDIVPPAPVPPDQQPDVVPQREPPKPGESTPLIV